MKNFISKKSLLLLSAAATLFAGCSDRFEEADNIEKELFTFEATASLPGDSDTRVSIGSYDASKNIYPLTWDGDETLAVVNGAESYSSAGDIPQATISETDGKTASFKVSLPADRGYTYYAVSPASAVESGADGEISLNFPTVQTPTNGSADPEAVMMVSEGSQIDGGRLAFRFGHIASYAKMTLKGLDIDNINSVTFTAEGKAVSGAYVYRTSDADGAAKSGAADHVTVNGTNLTADGDGNFTVWFSVIPFALNGKFTVTVTDTNNNTYTKDCDASKTPLNFIAGRIIGFTVDMTPKEEEVSNTYVVIAKTGSTYYAMSGEADGTRLGSVILNDYNGQNPYQTSNTNIVWTLIDNGNGTYYLENGGNYLYWSSGNTASAGKTPLALDVDLKNGYIQVHSDKSRYLTLNTNNQLNYFGFYTSSGSNLIRNLLIVPANGNTGGGNNGGGDEKDPDEGGDGEDTEFVYRTGWPELPRSNEYVYQTNYRRDNDNNDYYYAHHLCPDVNNAQNNGRARNYTVCFSAKHHCPLWVAAPRHAKYEKGSGRSESYKADPNIPSNLQYNSTSVGSSGCNKGHMLGSAERTVTSATNAQVFYYSNIAPQDATSFNTGGGAWNVLEDWVDGKVCQDTTYVVIGAYFDNYTDKLRGYNATAKKISYCGRTDVSWPTMFYYVILRTKKGNTGKSIQNCSADEIMCAAFVRSHNCAKGTKITSQDMMSVAELEQLTGFTYFANVQNAPKDSFNPSDWGL